MKDAALVKLATVALVLTVPAVAAADRGELTELSPSTLEPGEVRVGMFDVGIGLWGAELLERIELSSHHFVWGGWALGVPAYDVRGKFEFWRQDALSLSFGIGHTRVDLSPLVADGDGMTSVAAAFAITPIEGWAGARLGRRTRATAGVVYTAVSVRGSREVGPIDALGGAVGTTNLELHATLQHQLARRWHLIAVARALAYQAQWAELRGEDMTSEGSTTAGTARIEGDVLGVGRAYTLGARAHYARRHFNLRIGVDVGNYHVPVVNLVAPSRGIAPAFDVYWRF